MKLVSQRACLLTQNIQVCSLVMMASLILWAIGSGISTNASADWWNQLFCQLMFPVRQLVNLLVVPLGSILSLWTWYLESNAVLCFTAYKLITRSKRMSLDSCEMVMLGLVLDSQFSHLDESEKVGWWAPWRKLCWWGCLILLTRESPATCSNHQVSDGRALPLYSF